MGDKSKIEWTDATWNVNYGCTWKSPGCDNCYAVKVTQRLAGNLPTARGLVNPGKRHFNGTVRCLPDRLDQPLRWKRPRRIFVNSLSDLFHPNVPFEFVDKVFAVMGLCPQHTFQVLTKRPDRMREYMTDEESVARIFLQAHDLGAGPGSFPLPPFPNVWLGTSVENQETADQRIPYLLHTPAAVRWLSMEPLLGPVNISRLGLWLFPSGEGGWNKQALVLQDAPFLDWVVCGGESGPKARPMHPDWVSSIRDQCQAARVPFLFKQWGEWVTTSAEAFCKADPTGLKEMRSFWPDGRFQKEFPKVDDGLVCTVKRVGKKVAGRDLDGKIWDEYPGAPT